MTMFAIETRSDNHDWIDDPQFLGWGCVENDNRWNSESEALAACDELAEVFG